MGNELVGRVWGLLDAWVAGVSLKDGGFVSDLDIEGVDAEDGVFFSGVVGSAEDFAGDQIFGPDA